MWLVQLICFAGFFVKSVKPYLRSFEHLATQFYLLEEGHCFAWQKRVLKVNYALFIQQNRETKYIFLSAKISPDVFEKIWIAAQN